MRLWPTDTAADNDDETAAADGPTPAQGPDGRPIAESADGPQPAAAARALDLDQVALTEESRAPIDFEDGKNMRNCCKGGVTETCTSSEDEEKLHEQAKIKAAEAYRKSRARAEEFDRAARLGEDASESQTPMDSASFFA